MSKPQLHVSMLNTLARCGIQFQRRYGARFGVWPQEEIIPPGIALAVGISTHKAIEVNLSHKIEIGKLLPLEAVAETARDSFEGVWQGGMLLTEEEAADQVKAKGSAIDLSVALACLHAEELAPEISPTAVEQKFLIVLDGYPLDLSGTIDIIEPGTVRDTKTMGKSPGPDAARSLQMAMYSLAYKTNVGNQYPSKVCIDALVKTKEPKLVTIEAVPEKAWIDPLLRRVERATEIIESVKSGKQAFMPAQADDWICSAKWCGYARSCPFWSGRE